MENKAITVNIPRWETDSLELICGIANAGGGYVLLPTSQKDYSSGLRRARRKFESIPDSITQGLGLTCPITPVMEGNEFFLEIDVPAALEPLGLHGVYWLYEDGVNTRQTYESISRSWRDEATTPWELKTLPYVEDEDLSGEALVAIPAFPKPRARDRGAAAGNHPGLGRGREDDARGLHSGGRRAPQLRPVAGAHRRGVSITRNETRRRCRAREGGGQDEGRGWS